MISNIINISKFLHCYILIILLTHNNVVPVNSVALSDPLFLTPLIKNGQITEARILAQVYPTNFSAPENVTSYSGFITVDQENGVHTFFWFFPAFNDYENAPLLLWSDGGPGVTGLFSVFNEQGPFVATAEQKLESREYTWVKNHSIIYMDQPMDVGFSFTEKEEGYVATGIDTAPNIYKFLLQFFKLFPELRDNDFYNSGVSFGGIYAPAAAHYIHTQNQDAEPEAKINLKGLILETPWSDGMSQVDYGEYLYHVGLIDDHGREEFKIQSGEIKELIAQEKYEEAQEIHINLLLGNTYGSYFTNITGFASTYNILEPNLKTEFGNFYPIVSKEEFRNALHVGNLTFNFVSSLVQNKFRPTMLMSVKPFLETLLNSGDYKILIYGGNMDVSTSHMGLAAMIRNFQWDGAEEYAQSRNQIWKVGADIAGYAREARNLTYVVMRNAGHGAIGDQQAWGYDLVNRFTRNVKFTESQ